MAKHRAPMWSEPDPLTAQLFQDEDANESPGRRTGMGDRRAVAGLEPDSGHGDRPRDQARPGRITGDRPSGEGAVPPGS